MQFNISLMLSKAVMVGVRSVIALVGAETLSKYGVSVNETILTGALMGLIESLRGVLKQKYADKLGFFKFLLN